MLWCRAHLEQQNNSNYTRYILLRKQLEPSRGQIIRIHLIIYEFFMQYRILSKTSGSCGCYSGEEAHFEES